MTKRGIALASCLLALALAVGAAEAQVQAPPGGGNVVGGGGASIFGGGDNMVITYNFGGAGEESGLLSQPGRFARFAGSSDGTQVEYLSPAPVSAGREAWLVGGGENAEVVYSRPR
jgi:hypothetical protein